MTSRADGVPSQFFPMAYLVMLSERRHDYHFATQERTLAVLSGSGSRNPQTWDERSPVYDLKGGLKAKKASIESINQKRGNETNRSAARVACVWAQGPGPACS